MTMDKDDSRRWKVAWFIMFVTLLASIQLAWDRKPPDHVLFTFQRQTSDEEVKTHLKIDLEVESEAAPFAESVAMDQPALSTQPTLMENHDSNRTATFQSAIQQDFASYEAVEVVATGYYAGRESTGKDPGHPQYGITYSGIEVKRDEQSVSTIAADLDLFPLGTVMFIPGYGYGIVADKGSAIQGHKIDLYFDTIEDVFKQWGKKTVSVYVIKRGEGLVTQEIMNEISETMARHEVESWNGSGK